MNTVHKTGEGSELPALDYTPTDEDYKAVANSDPRTRAAMAACFLAADRQLKAALSSPQQEWISVDQELPQERIRVLGWDGIIVEDCFYGRPSSITQQHLSCAWRRTNSEALSDPITHWQPLPAPPVTAEGKDRG